MDVETPTICIDALVSTWRNLEVVYTTYYEMLQGSPFVAVWYTLIGGICPYVA